MAAVYDIIKELKKNINDGSTNAADVVNSLNPLNAALCEVIMATRDLYDYTGHNLSWITPIEDPDNNTLLGYTFVFTRLHCEERDSREYHVDYMLDSGVQIPDEYSTL